MYFQYCFELCCFILISLVIPTSIQQNICTTFLEVKNAAPVVDQPSATYPNISSLKQCQYNCMIYPACTFLSYNASSLTCNFFTSTISRLAFEMSYNSVYYVTRDTNFCSIACPANSGNSWASQQQDPSLLNSQSLQDVRNINNLIACAQESYRTGSKNFVYDFTNIKGVFCYLLNDSLVGNAYTFSPLTYAYQSLAMTKCSIVDPMLLTTTVASTTTSTTSTTTTTSTPTTTSSTTTSTTTTTTSATATFSTTPNLIIPSTSTTPITTTSSTTSTPSTTTTKTASTLLGILTKTTPGMDSSLLSTTTASPPPTPPPIPPPPPTTTIPPPPPTTTTTTTTTPPQSTTPPPSVHDVIVPQNNSGLNSAHFENLLISNDTNSREYWANYPLAIRPAYIVLAGLGFGCIALTVVAVIALCQGKLGGGGGGGRRHGGGGGSGGGGKFKRYRGSKSIAETSATTSHSNPSYDDTLRNDDTTDLVNEALPDKDEYMNKRELSNID